MNDETPTFLKKTYDIIVVGGGPAGTSAARYAAQAGADVILFERDKAIGKPVRCGEGISQRGLKGHISLNGPWIANKIDIAELVAPDGSKITLQSDLVGYILNRDIFDSKLAEKARDNGAVVVTGADVFELTGNKGKIDGVHVLYKAKKFKVTGKIFIGADGVESKIGRMAGINTLTKFNNMESSVQVTAEEIIINKEVCRFYFGQKYAPGGYLWIFPKTDTSANIGVGISGNNSKKNPAEYYLKKFMSEKYPEAKWTNYIAGGVPCNPPLKRLTKNNVMLVGDAGHQINPLTGAGIANALQAGKIAGEVAADAVKSGNKMESCLEQYTKKWYRSRGRLHKSNTRLKNAVMKLSDKNLNEIAGLLGKLPKNEWSMTKIFMLALRKHPDLIIDSIKVFGKLK
ncbi:geranylgeranyl reductase family protein [candidate division KSB1 bacterium]